MMVLLSVGRGQWSVGRGLWSNGRGLSLVMAVFESAAVLLLSDPKRRQRNDLNQLKLESKNESVFSFNLDSFCRGISNGELIIDDGHSRG